MVSSIFCTVSARIGKFTNPAIAHIGTILSPDRLCTTGKIYAYFIAQAPYYFRVIILKTNKEVLCSILKTVQMGQSGIRCVEEQAKGSQLRQVLQDQLSEYDTIERQAYALATRKGWLMEPLSSGVERMSSMMARMQLMGNNKDSKIAKMLVQGNTRGMIKGLKNLHHCEGLDPSVDAIAQKLLTTEQENIRQACRYL